jgi:predicted DNA-binding protein (MmcQ/YjbR family)
MDLKHLREYCLKKKGTSEDFPFDDKALVFKVGPKMFALTNINKKPLCVNLKCDPMLAVQFRQEFKSVEPGYHMNKTHWNTIYLDGSIPDEKIKWMIDHSYELVFNGLKKADRESLLQNNR